MTSGDIIFQQTNFTASIVLLCYLFFFMTFSTVTTFVTINVYNNPDKYRAAKPINRRIFFLIYLILNMSNIPFGLFISLVFKKLGAFSLENADPIYKTYPLYELASLGVLTGMASHILFVAFWILAWMHVEAGVKSH